MSTLNVQKEGIIGSGSIPKPKLSFTPEFQAPSKKVPWKLKNDFYLNNTTELCLKTLEAALTFRDETSRGFWNASCAEINSVLWLPHKTESLVKGSHSLIKSQNFTDANSSFWKNQLLPKTSASKHLLLSSRAFVIPKVGDEIQIGTRKIRVYPKNKEKWFEILNLTRRAYNLFIDFLNKDSKLDKSILRKTVRELVREEAGERTFLSSAVDEASLKAYKTQQALWTKWKKGEKAKAKFKSVKEAKQSFILQKIAANPIKSTGGCLLTEPLPKEALGKQATVLYEYGRWYVCVKKFIKLSSVENQELKVCAIDPGVRTFATTYAQDEAVFYGDGFSKGKLLPLFKKLKKLLSRRAILVNKKVDKQWWYDQIRHLNKAINKLQAKKQDLVADLHRRTAYDLVQNFDLIFLPTFETKQMTRRKGRKINRTTVRAMLDLGHYKFKLLLKWMAKKYGKVVVDCDESYTSKTGFDGKLIESLGGRKTIRLGKISVDRDINGARNIFIKNVTQTLESTCGQV